MSHCPPSTDLRSDRCGGISSGACAVLVSRTGSGSQVLHLKTKLVDGVRVTRQRLRPGTSWRRCGVHL